MYFAFDIIRNILANKVIFEKPNFYISNSQESLPKSRIEALSDGIFAIVMTIIVLELRVPETSELELSSKKIFEFLFHLLPKIETYIISFIISGVFWLRHQLHFLHVTGADRVTISINLFFLLFVTFIPFTTGFVMNFPNTEIPFLLYGFNLLIVSILLVINWKYVSKGKRLISNSMSDKDIRQFTNLTYLAPIIFMLAISISFVSIRIATFMLYLEPLLYFFFRSFKERKLKQKNV